MYPFLLAILSGFTGTYAVKRVGFSSGSFTLKKLECLKQAYAMNTLAWNNDLGLLSFCWFSRMKVMIDRDSWGC